MSGPYKQLPGFGGDIPYYVVRFGKDGACLSPEAVDNLLGALQSGSFSHVLLYSHGWNNDFPTATRLYDSFLNGLSVMDAARSVLASSFKPLFVGVAWPSTALSFGSEDGPDIAALTEDELAPLVDELPSQQKQSATTLLGQETIALDDARLVADWLSEAQVGETDGEVAAGQPDASEILEGWIAASQLSAPAPATDGFTGFGTAPISEQGPAALQAAGWPEFLDPRWIVRLGTVLIMKDRAGIVGANGVADLIGRLIGESNAKLFLFGHSYGCKVVMTALAALSGRTLRRKIDGVLLLQPAVSRLCFAADLGGGVAGGFVRTLPLVARPILATHSSRDFPLTRIFQLVARRSLDVGELQMAGEPSRFAALGGYGPGGAAPGTSIEVALPEVGTWPSGIATGTRIVSLDGSDSIEGHGDVNRAETFWAALNLMK